MALYKVATVLLKELVSVLMQCHARLSLKGINKGRKRSRIQLNTVKKTISQHLPGRNKASQYNSKDHDSNETSPEYKPANFLSINSICLIIQT